MLYKKVESGYIFLKKLRRILLIERGQCKRKAKRRDFEFSEEGIVVDPSQTRDIAICVKKDLAREKESRAPIKWCLSQQESSNQKNCAFKFFFLFKKNMLPLDQKAFALGATEFGVSETLNKRYYVVYNGKRINFGQPGAITYSDGTTIEKRNAFRARHSKIALKDRSWAYQNKNQPSFWSYHLLW